MSSRKLFFFFSFFLFFTANLYAQDKKIDSLQRALKMHTANDTTKVNLLNEIANANYRLDNDQLKIYAEQANKLAKEIQFEKGEALSWYLKGQYYYAKRKADSAKIHIKKALSLEEKSDRTDRISNCYYLLAHVNRMEEKYESSIQLFEKVIQIEKDENDQERIADALNTIGYIRFIMGEHDEANSKLNRALAIYDSLQLDNKKLYPLNNLSLIYMQQGRYTEALEYLQQCLTKYRAQKKDNNIASALLNMGLVHSYMDENNKALPYLEEGLAISKKFGDELRTSKFIIGLGYVHRFNKDYEKALEYYNEGLVICKKIESNEGLYNCYNNIGSLHIEREEYNLALKTIEKAMEASLTLKSKNRIAESHYQMGLVYFNLEKYEKATEYLLKAKELADEISLTKTQSESNRLLSSIYQEKNNYKAALERFKEHKILSDSLFNKEKIEKFTQLEYEYLYQRQLDSANIRELKLKQTVTATSKSLERSQRNFLIGIIVFLGVALLLGSIIFYLKLKNAREKNQNILIEQKLLRSQMTPHFIFNSLSVLQGMILNKEGQKSVSYLSKFSRLLRTVLENSRYKTVPLSDELTAIESYMGLQNMDASTPFNFQLLVAPKIDIHATKIPPMVIQPFVENAIEHAFKEHTEPKNIAVELTLKNEDLICTITDNGMGVSDKKQTLGSSKKSLATTITSERLKMLSKEFKSSGSLEIKNREELGEKGTIVTLMIPYKIKAAS
ncbi:MAG: tetratricopeptide repeat protein [Bacteroidota bacterium]